MSSSQPSSSSPPSRFIEWLGEIIDRATTQTGQILHDPDKNLMRDMLHWANVFGTTDPTYNGAALAYVITWETRHDLPQFANLREILLSLDPRDSPDVLRTSIQRMHAILRPTADLASMIPSVPISSAERMEERVVFDPLLRSLRLPEGHGDVTYFGYNWFRKYGTSLKSRQLLQAVVNLRDPADARIPLIEHALESQSSISDIQNIMSLNAPYALHMLQRTAPYRMSPLLHKLYRRNVLKEQAREKRKQVKVPVTKTTTRKPSLAKTVPEQPARQSSFFPGAPFRRPPPPMSQPTFQPKRRGRIEPTSDDDETTTNDTESPQNTDSDETNDS